MLPREPADEDAPTDIPDTDEESDIPEATACAELQLLEIPPPSKRLLVPAVMLELFGQPLLPLGARTGLMPPVESSVAPSGIADPPIGAIGFVAPSGEAAPPLVDEPAICAPVGWLASSIIAAAIEPSRVMSSPHSPRFVRALSDRSMLRRYVDRPTGTIKNAVH